MLTRHEQAEERIRAFYESTADERSLLIVGDALDTLNLLPVESIDTVITSPPYWNQREYTHPQSIGNEEALGEYIHALLQVFSEVKRVLKPNGSFWLNLGDTYEDKDLLGVPWRVAFALQASQEWILRNAVVWNKVKGNPDNSTDRLRNMYEMVFHFVKQKQYYYDADAIRNKPKRAFVQDGKVVTATGVSGINYRRQIERSSDLTDQEKRNALAALDEVLQKVATGELFDFRMVIRGQQRATHSDSARVSGRAAELERKGFYILPYHENGSKPGDVWEIIPEDSWRKDAHYAPFPLELCMIPIKATCPMNGIVLDPFAGTGTAIVAAVGLGRRGIGIDISSDYLEVAQSRLADIQLQLF